MPQAFVARAIVAAIRALPGYPSLRVLDLSCGRGEILSELARDGCDVRGTHFRSDDYKLRDTPQRLLDGLVIDQGVDLLQPLPYDAGAFDVVVLSEVAEHLFTYIPVVHESGRILRPGGHLILSSPNVARLHSRLHFFFTGTHKLIRRRVGWDLRPDQLYAYHVNPVDFPLLHTLLFQAGLRVRELRFTRFKARHAWLLPLYPLVLLFTRLATKRHVAPGLQRQGEDDLFRWLVHPAMLASEQLLVIARKP